MDTNALAHYAQEHPEQARQAQEQFHALQSRAATDTDFRQQLLTDPRSAVAAFTGQDIPEGFNVVFIENKADATIVLPDYIDPDAELSDADLEAVAGGGTPLIALTVAVFLASAGGGYYVGTQKD